MPFTIRSQGAGTEVTVEVRVNGRPVNVESLTLPRTLDGTARGIARLQVPEPNAVIQLIARDKFGVSEPLNFRIEGSPALAPARPPGGPATASNEPPAQPAVPLTLPRTKLYVLAIGISRYQRDEYRLGLPAKDATDFVAAMQRQKGKFYGDVEVKTLTNQDATRAAILQGLDWLSTAVGPGDVAMLFVAGHGLNEPGGQYYFLPYDGIHDRLRTTAVPEQVIRATLGRIRGRVLFFVDTCFAGNVVGTFQTASRELAKLANELASAENGVVVFASSAGRQQSEEKDEWGNGAFTKALIDGLSGKADLTKTGRVTFKGLDFFVSEEVKRLTGGRQTPVTITPIGVPDFTLARITI